MATPGQQVRLWQEFCRVSTGQMVFIFKSGILSDVKNAPGILEKDSAERTRIRTILGYPLLEDAGVIPDGHMWPLKPRTDFTDRPWFVGKFAPPRKSSVPWLEATSSVSLDFDSYPEQFDDMLISGLRMSRVTGRADLRDVLEDGLKTTSRAHLSLPELAYALTHCAQEEISFEQALCFVRSKKGVRAVIVERRPDGLWMYECLVQEDMPRSHRDTVVLQGVIPGCLVFSK